MTAGFTTWRNGSAVQVDDNYRTLTLSRVETASISTTNSMSDVRFYSVGVSSSVGFVACRSEILYSALVQAKRSGGSLTFTFALTTLDTSASETVKFYVFEPPALSADNFGVEVYNASAQLCFTDHTNPVRVMGLNAASSSYSGTSGRIYAPIIMQRQERATNFNGVLWNLHLWFYRCNTNQIEANEIIWRRHTSPVGADGSYLIADVTHY